MYLLLDRALKKSISISKLGTCSYLYIDRALHI